MNSDKDKNFERSMKQLLSLLKKILKNLPSQGPLSPMNPALKDSGVNLNLCFFTFLPILPEDWEEWEELYDTYLSGEEKADEFSSELSPADIEFLRRHGIRF